MVLRGQLISVGTVVKGIYNLDCKHWKGSGRTHSHEFSPPPVELSWQQYAKQVVDTSPQSMYDKGLVALNRLHTTDGTVPVKSF